MEGVAPRVRVAIQLPRLAADVDQSAAGAEEGEQRLRRREGAVVVGLQGLLDDGAGEALQRDAGVVDDDIEPVGVCASQVVAEAVDAGAVADVQFMEDEGRGAAIPGEGFGGDELRVVVEGVDGRGAAVRRACREVNQEGSGLDRGIGILECKIANWRVMRG